MIQTKLRDVNIALVLLRNMQQSANRRYFIYTHKTLFLYIYSAVNLPYWHFHRNNRTNTNIFFWFHRKKWSPLNKIFTYNKLSFDRISIEKLNIIIWVYFQRSMTEGRAYFLSYDVSIQSIYFIINIIIKIF